MDDQRSSRVRAPRDAIHEHDGAVPGGVRPDLDLDTPFSTLLFCSLAAAGAFLLPMLAVVLLPAPVGENAGAESVVLLQSVGRQRQIREVRLPKQGSVVPSLRASHIERAQVSAIDACVDPDAWRSL